ncbi:hypothetical protein HPB49_026459 [Dermacentor silvarum]|nr:hypothetical protein HPB49_026459 [Dermacentor silvarum]
MITRRKDVCPTTTIKTCLACGLANPKEEHRSTPKCRLCGGEHPTGDRTCKAKYKIPYVVRKRQWELRQGERQLPSESDFPPLDKPPVARKSSTPSENRAPKSRDSSCCKRSLSRKMSPSRERTLRQENAVLRTTINNLTREIAEIRKLLLCNNEPLQRPTPSTRKTGNNHEHPGDSRRGTCNEEASHRGHAQANRKRSHRQPRSEIRSEIQQTRTANHGEHRSSDTNETNNGELPSREHEQIRVNRKDPTADREPPDVCAPLRAASTQPGNPKEGLIQQHIAHAARKPDVILQETLTNAPSLPGYRVHKGPPDGKGRCTLVRKGLTLVEHELQNNIKIKHKLTEIIQGKKRKGSIFLLNVYSNPSQRKQRFKTLLHRASTVGYNKHAAKGPDLYQGSAELDFTLITDPTHPTRIGKSVSREKHGTDLGSDHTIVQIGIPKHNDTSMRTHRWIDWDSFRDARNQNRDGDNEIKDINS